jgi:hypothetical protein
MAIASGLGSSFGLAQETTYGTVVTPNRFYEFDSAALALDQTYQESVGLRAGRTFAPSGRTKRTTRQAGGTTPMDVPTKDFGSVLNLMHSLTVTPVQQAATAAYLQTHLIGTSQPNRSATLQTNGPTSQAADYAFTWPGSVLTSAAFSLDTGGILKTTLTWDSADELTPDTTPTGPSLTTPSYATGISSWTHVDVVSLTMNSVAVAGVKSINWTWTQPYKTDRWFLGSGATKAKPIPNGLATIEGTMDLEWYDTAAYLLFRAGTFASLVFDLQGATIASTYKEQFKSTMSAVQYRGGSPGVDGPDVLDASVPFVAKDDSTNPPWKVEYMETRVTI